MMRRIFKVSTDFEFTATMLVGMIGHDCGCESCSDTRQRALSALLWLVANNSRVRVKFEDGPGGVPEMHMQMPRQKTVAVPVEIVEAAKARLDNANLTPEQRAAINGFLAGAEHGES